MKNDVWLDPNIAQLIDAANDVVTTEFGESPSLLDAWGRMQEQLEILQKLTDQLHKGMRRIWNFAKLEPIESEFEAATADESDPLSVARDNMSTITQAIGALGKMAAANKSFQKQMKTLE